ncbi:hypothetical protein [Streptomyces sp. NPDC056169]|uniref:hypothetical protein n=1 Tax=Streptomyces sp. NPDC056169 TaxID=3345734 RepID=UPI0035D74900
MSGEGPEEGITQSVNANGESVVFNLGQGTQSNEVTQYFYGGGALAGADPETCYRYGRMKLEARDFQEAEFPLLTAAEAGNIEAGKLLVLLYEVTKRANNATAWTQRLAEVGDPQSCYKVASRILMRAEFAQGATRRKLDQTEEYESAISWLRKSTEGGVGVANEKLGIVLFGLERYEEAIPYLERAANPENEDGASPEAWWRLKSARKHLKKQKEKGEPKASGVSSSRWWKKSE